jgi:CheY-like chemotaxis protein
MMSSAIQPLQLTVLVVDDEEPLRHYMGRVLADDGYRVLVAGNGLEALAAVTVTQICLVHCSESHFYRTI